MPKRLLLTLSLPGLGFLTGAVAEEALPSPLGLVVPLLIILALVLLNGLYVAAEFAIIGVRRTQLEPLVSAGNRTADQVVNILRAPRQQDRYIATAQLGITIASLGLGMYGEPQIAHFVEPYLAQALGVEVEAGSVQTLGYVLSLGLLTYLHIVVGEMIPKTLALSAATQMVLGVAMPMQLSQLVFALPVRLLNAAGNFLLRLFRIPPVGLQAHLHSPEELEILIDESTERGLIQPGEREMVHNIFEFGDRHVHQVMTPRVKIQAIASDLPLPEVLRLVAESTHSRFPVYEQDLDNTLGILYLQDLIRQQTRTKGQFDLRLLLRPALALPEHYPVSKVLAAFRRTRSQMAIVMDEFGGTAGLVTLEDLVEEIMGEIRNEFDRSPAPIQKRPDGSALVDGLTTLNDLNDYFGLTLYDPHYDTVAGFVLGRLGRMARVGDEVEAGGVRLRVEALDGLRIARLSFYRTAPAGGLDAEAGSNT